MKLKSLKIHNIASIEDATIDFDGKDLRNEDLFLISGPTGSGKTTILDAICIALFDKTPRQESTQDRKLAIESDEEGKEPIKVKDILHLVRNNAVEASIVLTFEADGREYTATWRAYRKGQYNRGREATTFSKLSLEEKIARGLKKEWTLTDDEGVNTEKDVDKAIAGIIKMNFEQFCKTTMLAQGDFTKFLSSSTDDKAQILEKLVGTELYGRVGSVINTQANEKKAEVDLLAKELEHFKFISDEDRQTKQEEIERFSKEINSLNKEKEETDKKILWIENKEKAKEAVMQNKTTLERAEAALQTDESKQQSQTLALWDRTTEVRRALTDKQKCEKAKVELETKKTLLVSDYSEKIRGYNYIVSQKGRVTEGLNRLSDAIAREKCFETMYTNAKVICSKHTSLVENEKYISEMTPKVTEYQTNIDNINEKLNTLETEKKGINEHIEQLEDSIKAQNEKLKALSADTIDREVTDLNSHKSLVANAERTLQQLNATQEDYGNKQKISDGLNKEVETLTADYINKEQQYISAKTTAQESKDLYDKTLQSVSDHAKALRVNLRAGDQCPVCGSTVERLLSEDELSNALKPLYDKYKEDEDKAKKVEESYNETKAKALATSKALANAIKDTSVAESRLKQQQTTFKRECGGLDIDPSSATAELFAQYKQADEEKQKGIEARQEAIRAIRKEIDSINGQISQTRKTSLETVEKSITGLKRDLEKQSKNKDQATGGISKAQNTIETLKTEIAELVNPDWRPTESTRYYEELKTAADCYTKTKNDITSLEAKIQTLTQEIDIVSACRESVCQLFPELNDIRETESLEVPKLGHEWSKLRSDAQVLAKGIKDTAEIQKDAEDKISQYLAENTDVTIDAIKALLPISPIEITAIRESYNSKTEALSKAKALYEAAVVRLEEFTVSPLQEGENLETLKEKSESVQRQITLIAEKKGRLQQELITDEENRRLQGEKKKTLDTKREEYAEWALLNRYLGSTDGKLFRNVAQSFILSELLDKANAYLANISKRYTLFCKPGSLTIMMRDAYQGGVERTTNTLSGGESFIISLSLALGLSSMQNVDFEVDTLFIDEGFGTLSPEYLDPVITALKRLYETYGRRVGIISHVESLRSRIPVAIEVTKKGNSASEVRIVR